eukprot:7344309-Pyramimonas_sp.AAC.1
MRSAISWRCRRSSESRGLGEDGSGDPVPLHRDRWLRATCFRGPSADELGVAAAAAEVALLLLELAGHRSRDQPSARGALTGARSHGQRSSGRDPGHPDRACAGQRMLLSRAWRPSLSMEERAPLLA